jgi:hypothetical protein
VALRSEQSRQRIAAAATLLHDLWGDGLPPGPAPWQRIAGDVFDVDDGFGEQQGLAVQGDDFGLTVLAEALSYVPAGASLRGMLPQRMIDRIEQATAVRDPGAHTLAIGARLLSVAIRSSGARWAGIYRNRGPYALLESSLGMTPWERIERSRIMLPGDGALCRAMQQGVTGRDEIEVPEPGGGWGGEPSLVWTSCVAVAFPSAGVGAPASGALLLTWPSDGDPDASVIGPLVRPYAAEAEHMLATAH